MIKYYTKDTFYEYFEQFEPNKIETHSKNYNKYYNIPCTFDIETTSAYVDLKNNNIIEAREIVKYKEANKEFNPERYKKVCWMYTFQFSIDDKLYLGRTWDEFIEFIKELRNTFGLNHRNFMIFYVRNLAFEFEFIKSYLPITKVFATAPHKPIYATCEDLGIQFKCSYFLSNESLDQSGKNLIKYKALKKTGQLDYNLIRTPDTILSDDEIEYCLYDVIVDSNYIRERMEDEKNCNILKIPLTKTGYVRRYIKEHVLSPMNRKFYYSFIHQFNLDEEYYNQLQRVFTGGFTHSSALNTNVLHKNVASYDLTSSYPSVIVLEPMFPVKRFQKYQVKSYADFKCMINKFCCIFDIEFINIRQKEDVFENIISESKCFIKENAEENNGRIISADRIATSICDIDYMNIIQFYDFDSIKIANFRFSKRGYLPRQLIECVLKFYKDKTTLKDVLGEESNYQNGKGMLNSIFGMMVQNPLQPVIDFINNDFVINSETPIPDLLTKYNKKIDRFTAYEHGIYITALAKRNVLSGVKALGIDYIYCDTDSLKFKNLEKHLKFFENYNKLIDKKIKAVCDYYNFDISDFKPKTIKGIEKPIGYFDFDGKYDTFKTLGAKRYLTQTEDATYHLTCAGLSKKTALPYMEELAKENKCSVFNIFTDELFIPGEYSGKLLHSYINEEYNFYCKDYQGHLTYIEMKSGVHLEPSAYTLELTLLYKMLLNNIHTHYYLKNEDAIKK